jgi:hypothetical protein
MASEPLSWSRVNGLAGIGEVLDVSIRVSEALRSSSDAVLIRPENRDT